MSDQDEIMELSLDLASSLSDTLDGVRGHIAVAAVASAVAGFSIGACIPGQEEQALSTLIHAIRVYAEEMRQKLPEIRAGHRP